MVLPVLNAPNLLELAEYELKKTFSKYLEYGKLRALRAENVLTVQRVLRAYVLTCQRALRAYVLTWSRANVPCMFTWQRALLAYVLTCQRALHA